MAIGERIRYLRTLREMTQKQLGVMVGFPEKSADVRLAQYESGVRTPKEELTAKLAEVLGVRPAALSVPDIDTDVGLMHTLFALEDTRALKIGEIDGEICIRIDKSKGFTSANMFEMLYAWQQQRAKYEAGELSDEEYNQWRYTYPKELRR